MKVPITLTIEHEKKVLFESLKDVHKKTFSDILNDGLNACLSEISPVALVQEEILQAKLQLAELEQKLLKAQIFEEHRKLQQKATKQEGSDVDYLESMRNQRFEEGKDSLVVMWKRLDMNWSRIVDLYQFKNTTEAKEWFARKMAEVGA
jgi:hypothetical protein